MTRAVAIAGGARGIGRALALTLARDGWRVAVSYLRADDQADTLRDALAEITPRAMVSRCDLTRDAARWIDDVTAALGPVDALVYTAGPFSRGELATQDAAAWRAAFDDNVAGYVTAAQSLVPGMRARRWGRVLGFGAAGAATRSPPPAVAAYHAAKAAVVAYTRALAVDAARDGVTANVISPGVIDTGALPDALFQQVAAKVPAGRAGTVDEVVHVARFLLSDEARYVTGADIPVDGGFSLR